jgi:hypothetical protein
MMRGVLQLRNRVTHVAGRVESARLSRSVEQLERNADCVAHNTLVACVAERVNLYHV